MGSWAFEITLFWLCLTEHESIPPSLLLRWYACLFIIIIVIIINISYYNYEWLMINSSSDYYFYYYYYYLVILMLLLSFFGVQRLYMYLFFSVRGSQPPGVFTTFLFDRLLYYFRIPRTRKIHACRLYCHNLHSTKSYKPMWVLDGVPIIALMQLLTYLFDLFRFYSITTTLTGSNAHKKPQAKRALVC